MATEEEDAGGKGQYIADAMKVAIAVLFFFLIPVAVSRNAFGVAEKFSGLPGISKTGGIASGVAAAVCVFGVAGVVAGGGIVATGGDLPTFGGGEGTEPVDPVPGTPTATPEPTSTPTAEPEPATTSTPEPTPTPKPGALTRFENNYRELITSTLENETLTGVPVLATEYRENDQGQTVLWVVFWECDQAMPEDAQWSTIGNTLITAAGQHEGEMPARVRVYSVTNLVNFEDETAYINTSDARAVYNYEMELGTYSENWWERRHTPSQVMNDTAYQMVVDESGQVQADDAFYNDHLEVSYCPGPAEVGTGSDAYNGD